MKAAVRATRSRAGGPARLTPAEPPGSAAPPHSSAAAGEDRVQVEAGRLACGVADMKDHPAVYHFLRAVFQEPTPAEFQASLEAPRYEPLDRILFRRGSDIVAHLQLSHRAVHFDGQTIPSVDLRHLGVLPEYRQLGLATALLQAMETETNLHSAKIATVRTRAPALFRQQGWVTWLHHAWSTAAPRRLLSRLESLKPVVSIADGPVGRMPRQARVGVRLWRRSELEGLRWLYARQMHGQVGTVARDEADWQWLVAKRGFDRIYVALPEAAAASESPAVPGDVSGYAVAHEGRIVELVADRETDAARQLLARFCRDAIEAGRHAVRLEAPPQDSLHRAFAEAGGQTVVSSQSEGWYLMAKLLYPYDWLRSLKHTLASRAAEYGCAVPWNVSLGIGDQTPWLIRVQKRHATFERRSDGRQGLTVTPRGLQSLLLGQHAAGQLAALGHAHPFDWQTLERAEALFPPLHGWRNVWEDLPARRD